MSSSTVERHLNRASGSAILAFAAATVAYALKGAHWALLHVWGLQASAFNDVIGVINWMGGPMDVGFYVFLTSEGVQSMVFAYLERNEWRRRLAEERTAREAAEKGRDAAEERREVSERRWEAAEERREAAEMGRDAAEKSRDAAEKGRDAAEKRIQELERQLADSQARRDDS